MLRGKRHTHFDDVESFLYVLLLFFFSYAGPLPKAELERAHENRFVRHTGSGRLPHMRCWPQKLADWADGEADDIALAKYFHVGSSEGLDFLDENIEVRDCLRDNWPANLQSPIHSLLDDAFEKFRESRKGGKTLRERTEVPHDKFIKVLDVWLIEHSSLEDEYSNCPDFKDPRLAHASP